MRPALARALASAFLAGPWECGQLIGRGSVVVRRRTDWLPRITRELLQIYPAAPADRPRELAAFLETFEVAELDDKGKPTVPPRVLRRTVAGTRMVRNPWHLPVLDDLDDVARLLDLTQGELAWFADPKRLARRENREPLLHYRISSRPSASGGVRVLEAPKPRLREMQRRLLREVLDGIPLHDAAHGFRRRHSVGSYGAPHSGQAVVLHLDLQGFFASVSASRVYGILRTAGYPEPVAHCLTGLTTTVLPLRSWRDVPPPTDPALHEAHWRLGRRLAAPHLPQGAPTSPALANLAAWRLDLRLTALAQTWGGRYTRYADDLALSGGRSWGRGTSRLLDAVEGIARDEGFLLNSRKTGVQLAAGRQVLAGLVVNDRPRVARAEVDLLKAILHNCGRHGPAGQNRDGHPDFRLHLLGRVGWVAQHDPVRGARLRAQLDAVDWT